LIDATPSAGPGQQAAIGVSKSSQPFSSEAPPGPLSGDINWHSLVQGLGLVAMTRELANHCALRSLDETSCVLALDPQFAHLRRPRAEANLEKALQARFHRPLKLLIEMEAGALDTPANQIRQEKEERQRAAEIEIEQDEAIRALKERLDARIVPGSIKPLD
jgi:DNA polymerase-3 subunit gamma/tau